MFRYPSLKNERELALAVVGGDTRRYLVTEKFHGSNFQFTVDRVDGEMEIKAFRRNGEIHENDVFYGWKEIRERYRAAFEAMYYLIGNKFAIFGELIGGFYPGVKRSAGAIRVQNFIHYAPTNEFVVFDMCHVRDDGTRRFWEFDAMHHMAKLAGLHVVEPLYRDMTLADICAIDHENQTPGFPVNVLKLPEAKENFIEGFVIRLEEDDAHHTMYKRRTNRYLYRKPSQNPDAEFKKAVSEELMEDQTRVLAVLPVCYDAVRSKELEPFELKKNFSRYIDLVFDELKTELTPWKDDRMVRKLIGKFLRDSANQAATEK